MDKIRDLLNQVATINKKNAEILDATGGRFNMFSVCGVNHYENTHSAILAEFLSPVGSHGLKEKLLNAFIEILGVRFSVRDFDPATATIQTEKVIPNGRIDIMITDNDNKKAIIIENKVFAKEQWEQLKRYDEFARGRFGEGNYQILFLTLSGHEAEEHSGGNVVYEQISYHDTLIEWLERCVTIAARYPGVRETIIQYINHLKQLTNQDMSTKNEQEIATILSNNIENMRAAKSIAQNYSATFDLLAKKHFNPRMEEFAKDKSLDFIYHDSGEEHIHFELKNAAWQGYWIAFTYEKNPGPYYGITNMLTAKISAEERAIIHEHMMKSGGGKFKGNDVWWIYEFIPRLTLDIWDRDIVKSQAFFDDCCEKIKRLLAAMAVLEKREVFR